MNQSKTDQKFKGLFLFFILITGLMGVDNSLQKNAQYLPNHIYKNSQHVNKVNGDISEVFMSSYFKSSGWSQINGEIGVNGIDGLFIKRDNQGNVKDVLFVESKFNKSQLGYSKHLQAKQMSKKALENQVENLIKDTRKRIKKSTSIVEKQSLKRQLNEYKMVKRKIHTNQYRSRLFKVKPIGDKQFKVTIDALESKGNRDVIKKSLKGVNKYKVHETIIDLKKKYALGSYEDVLQKKLKKSIKTVKESHRLKRNYQRALNGSTTKKLKNYKALSNAVEIPAVIKKKGKKVLIFMDASVLKKSTKLKNLKFLKNVKGGDVVMMALEGGVAVYSVLNGTMGFKQVSKMLLKDKASDMAGYAFSKGVALMVPPPAAMGIAVAIAGEILISYGIDKYEEINKRKYVGLEDMLWDVPDEIKNKLTILNLEDVKGESIFDLDMIEKDTILDNEVDGESIFEPDLSNRESIFE